MPEGLAHDAEARIRDNARRYDLAALIAELRRLGYSDESIELRSNHSTLHQASLIESVELSQKPRPRAIITVNLGLLSPQSPLPSYFQQALDQQSGAQSGSLAAFLNFFSHRLIRADVAGMFPERDPLLFSNFSRTKQQLLSLIGLRSPAALHWLFESIFPELEVAVRRTMLMRPIRTRGMVLGEWTLGDGSVTGGLASAPASAVGVTLYCESPRTLDGEPWARAAERRLREQMFPLLRARGLFLEVAMVFRDQSTFMVLAPDQHLGYDPIYSGAAALAPQERTCHTVILWRGEVPRPDH